MTRRPAGARDREAKPFIVRAARPFDEGVGFLRQSPGALHLQREPRLRGEHAMSKKQSQIVRKPPKKIADARRVRYGGGSMPRAVRAADPLTQDSRTVRFGGGSMPASLRK
jgi:hypothetical protein